MTHRAEQASDSPSCVRTPPPRGSTAIQEAREFNSMTKTSLHKGTADSNPLGLAPLIRGSKPLHVGPTTRPRQQWAIM
jgi:hypothetical protein